MRTTMDEAKDRVLGKRGTPARETYEKELKEELEQAEATSKSLNLSGFFHDRSFQIVQKYERSKCEHKHVELDMTSRMTTCADCGLMIDPFDFIVSLAFEESYQANRILSLQEERRKLEREIKKLKSQVK